MITLQLNIHKKYVEVYSFPSTSPSLMGTHFLRRQRGLVVRAWAFWSNGQWFELGCDHVVSWKESVCFSVDFIANTQKKKGKDNYMKMIKVYTNKIKRSFQTKLGNIFLRSYGEHEWPL